MTFERQISCEIIPLVLDIRFSDSYALGLSSFVSRQLFIPYALSSVGPR